MYKIAVMGDYDSIYGFSALGLDICPVTNNDNAKNLLVDLINKGYGIIYITEALAAQLHETISRYKEHTLPAIILIPGVSGNTGAGIQGISRSVEQAVGSDILFGGTIS